MTRKNRHISHPTVPPQWVTVAYINNIPTAWCCTLCGLVAQELEGANAT